MAKRSSRIASGLTIPGKNEIDYALRRRRFVPTRRQATDTALQRELKHPKEFTALPAKDEGENESGELNDNKHTYAGDLPGVYLRDGADRLTRLPGDQQLR
ncbi:protein of unknown function [Serratia sp. Tan611]|nr:protein of unknown function [Serratia sp. Tan611]